MSLFIKNVMFLFQTKTFKHAAGCLTYNQKTLTVTACINGSLSQRWQIHSFVLPDGIL